MMMIMIIMMMLLSSSSLLLLLYCCCITSLTLHGGRERRRVDRTGQVSLGRWTLSSRRCLSCNRPEKQTRLTSTPPTGINIHSCYWWFITTAWQHKSLAMFSLLYLWFKIYYLFILLISVYWLQITNTVRHANLRTERSLLMEVSPPEVAVFPRANNALSLDADTTWPSNHLTHHVMVTCRRIQLRVAQLMTQGRMSRTKT